MFVASYNKRRDRPVLFHWEGAAIQFFYGNEAGHPTSVRLKYCDTRFTEILRILAYAKY